MTPFLFDFTLGKPNVEYIKEFPGKIHVPEKQVSDTQNRCPYIIPSIDGIYKKIERMTYRVDKSKFFSDVLACGAIAIANKTDLAQAEEREQTYLKIINSYRPAERESLVSVFGDIFILLSSVVYSDGWFDDYLGELFMRCNIGNKQAGQFFTPYYISQLMARITLNESMVKQKSAAKEIITINDPCCGGGGMLIAAIDVLQNTYGVNYARDCFVDCGDIDIRCVHMTYLQLSLAGVPAVIRHQNTLTREQWSVWYTPAFLFQYLRFRKFVV